MPLHASEVLPADEEAHEAQITELAAHIHAATYRLLTLIGELDRREIWADHACRSCAHWLSWKCGIDIGAGREKVRTPKALQSLPQISAAFRQGRGENGSGAEMFPKRDAVILQPIRLKNNCVPFFQFAP